MNQSTRFVPRSSEPPHEKIERIGTNIGICETREKVSGGFRDRSSVHSSDLLNMTSISLSSISPILSVPYTKPACIDTLEYKFRLFRLIFAISPLIMKGETHVVDENIDIPQFLWDPLQ